MLNIDGYASLVFQYWRGNLQVSLIIYYLQKIIYKINLEAKNSSECSRQQNGSLNRKIKNVPWKETDILELYSRMFMNIHDKTRVSFKF